VGDFGGNGRNDILWRDDSGEVRLWQIDGAQVLLSDNLGVVGRDWHIADTGDYDGDANADILWRNDSGQVGEWLMKGAQVLSTHNLGFVGNDWTIAADHSDYI
jgi:hypothetical protein